MADNPYRSLHNFNAGELTPLLNAREDLAKFQSGCSVMENLIPIPQGGAEKRPGTKYIAEVKTSSLKTRLLPFEFSTSQSYIIEAGNQYMRFYTDGAQVEGNGGTEDYSGLDNLVAHWLMNDDAANQTVLDDDGGTHNGSVSISNTEDLQETGIVNGSLNFGGVDAVEITDHGDFTFIEGVNGDFSIAAWVYISSDASRGQIPMGPK